MSVLVRRDVTRGNHLHHSYVRPGSAAAAVPAIAATAGEYSSDENLVERIAAGDRTEPARASLPFRNSGQEIFGTINHLAHL